MTEHSTGAAVLHEFIETDKQGYQRSHDFMADYTVLSGRFGARSNMANKYLLDAVSLEKRFTALKMKT